MSARYQVALARIRHRPFSFGNPVDAQLLQDHTLKVDTANELLANSDQLARHIAVMGVSGSGKSKFLEQLGRHFIDTLNGFTFIDPHGDTAEALLAYIVQEKGESFLDQVHYLEPTTDLTFSFDPFARLFADPNPDTFAERRIKLVEDLRGVLMRATAAADAEVMKRLKRYLTTMLTIIATPLDNGSRFSLADIDVFLSRFHDWHDEAVRRVRDNLPRAARQDLDELASLSTGKRSDEISSTVNLIRTFINPISEQVFGLHAPSIDFQEVIAKRKIVIVNLKTDAVHRDHTKPIAGFIIRELMNIAQSTPEEQRVPHNLMIDEAGEYLGEDFKDILEECRKYKLSLCVGGQTMSSFQLGDSVDIGSELQSHCKTVVCFQQRSITDVEVLARYLAIPNRILYQQLQPMQVDAPELDQIKLMKSWTDSHGGSRSESHGTMLGSGEGAGLSIAKSQSDGGSTIISQSHTDATGENTTSGAGTSAGEINSQSKNLGTSHHPMMVDGQMIVLPSSMMATGAGQAFSNNKSYFDSHGSSSSSADSSGIAQVESHSDSSSLSRSSMKSKFASLNESTTEAENWSKGEAVSQQLRTGSKIVWVPTGQPLYAIPYQDAIYEHMLSTLPQQMAFVRSQITGVEQSLLFRVHNMERIAISKEAVAAFVDQLADRHRYMFRKRTDADTAQERRLDAIFHGDDNGPQDNPLTL